MKILFEPWPWYIAGTAISVVMFLLIMLGKTFGISSNLKTICAICGGGKYVPFFNFNWKAYKWNLWLVLGVILGGYISVQFLNAGQTVDLNEKTIQALNQLHISGKGYLPSEIFSWTPKSIGLLAIAGLMVGFGSRYAGGCTSGHAITGLSNLQLPSLLAVIGFFIGGVLMVHLIFPLIF